MSKPRRVNSNFNRSFRDKHSTKEQFLRISSYLDKREEKEIEETENCRFHDCEPSDKCVLCGDFEECQAYKYEHCNEDFFNKGE